MQVLSQNYRFLAQLNYDRNIGIIFSILPLPKFMIMLKSTNMCQNHCLTTALFLTQKPNSVIITNNSQIYKLQNLAEVWTTLLQVNQPQSYLFIIISKRVRTFGDSIFTQYYLYITCLMSTIYNVYLIQLIKRLNAWHLHQLEYN